MHFFKHMQIPVVVVVVVVHTLSFRLLLCCFVVSVSSLSRSADINLPAASRIVSKDLFYDMTRSCAADVPAWPGCAC